MYIARSASFGRINLVNVHREIRFSSSPYVAGYIANNTAKRQQYKHDDVKNSFDKLMNNAPYGKTIENVARRSGNSFIERYGKGPQVGGEATLR